MKFPTITILTTGIAFCLASCGENVATETTEASTEQAANAEYPLTTCVVSGEELGSMGEPVVVEHIGTEVKLCCDQCLDKFNSDPAKYAKMVSDAK